MLHAYPIPYPTLPIWIWMLHHISTLGRYRSVLLVELEMGGSEFLLFVFRIRYKILCTNLGLAHSLFVWNKLSVKAVFLKTRVVDPDSLNTAEIFYLFLIKNCNLQVIVEAFSHQKITSNTSKSLIYELFSMFVSLFCPPGSESGSGLRIWIRNPDSDTNCESGSGYGSRDPDGSRIQSGSTTLLETPRKSWRGFWRRASSTRTQF